jgi:cobyrinic acid a,c-diamide synthase
MSERPRILIAGTSSGVGKTSLTLGLVRALARRKLRVQTFKVGPDFLDPTYLALASGRTCYNLDGWMTGREYVQDLFFRAAADADIAIAEGVMGLFDGASPTGLEGSSAEIALWLDAPVLLVANAHGAARSLAATVKGFAEFEPGLRLAGVIANQSGSERHRDWLREGLVAAGLPPLVGTVPRGGLPALQSRHLGLVTADRDVLPEETIERLADACEKHLDVDLILQLAKTAGLLASTPHPALAGHPLPRERGKNHDHPPARIGLARDKAFQFYYPDNLEILRSFGAELVEFSPLEDAHLPRGLGGIYLGGGYPEVHAAALAANESMLREIQSHAAQGRAIYAECGGLMYLGEAVTTVDGRRLAMAGVLPIETAMLERLKSLGYVEATASDESLWQDGRGGEPIVLRGHEFHYSEIVADRSAAEGWQPAYAVRRRSSEATTQEGYCRGLVLAGYMHAHFGSCPRAAERFVELCREIL